MQYVDGDIDAARTWRQVLARTCTHDNSGERGREACTHCGFRFRRRDGIASANQPSGDQTRSRFAFDDMRALRDLVDHPVGCRAVSELSQMRS